MFINVDLFRFNDLQVPSGFVVAFRMLSGYNCTSDLSVFVCYFYSFHCSSSLAESLFVSYKIPFTDSDLCVDVDCFLSSRISAISSSTTVLLSETSSTLDDQEVFSTFSFHLSFFERRIIQRNAQNAKQQNIHQKSLKN